MTEKGTDWMESLHYDIYTERKQITRIIIGRENYADYLKRILHCVRYGAVVRLNPPTFHGIPLEVGDFDEGWILRTEAA